MIIERKLLHLIMPKLKFSEAIVITGMRRVGKTTLLRQIFDRVESENKLFLDLENPINQKYFEEKDYEAIVYNLKGLGLDFKKRPFIFLDEIQFLKNTPSVVKYLIDHHSVKFFLTGSASFYLKNLFSESLAGRKFLFELFPFDFEEFLVFKGETLKIPKETLTSEALYSHFQTLYQEYVEFGGFPGVISKPTIQEKIDALNEIFSSYFNKEVLQVGDFRNNQVIRDLMLLLLQRVGSRIEIQKLASELGISRITLKEYLAFLEGTYFISLIKSFTKSKDIEIRRAPKFYCIDSGLVRQIGKVDLGHVFENAIFHQLRVKYETIHYYRRKTGAEIDFIANGRIAYEAKLNFTEYDIKFLERTGRDLDLDNIYGLSFRLSKAKNILYGFQL